MDNILKAAGITPSHRQLEWQRMEFYAFIHYGLNTYTVREWGDGTESPALFDPANLDCDQWVRSLKAAGMTGVIMTAKHHDGFCLWPSAYTEHSIKHSPWKNGKGDVIRELAAACRRSDFKLGIYLSPWDRHDERYGTDGYNDYFRKQLEELLTQYGPIFSVWFDGACGEGKNGVKQQYDWEGYYSLIRRLQPGAVINVVGPDVRWCGNEAGHCRKSEWSVVPGAQRDADSIADKSQKVDDGAFIAQFDPCDDDLGSREKIRDVDDLIWYPAETNTSIRPNWFYNPKDNKKVKSLNELFHLYCNSVGGNSTLLLNVPPNPDGLIERVDAERLKELGDCIRELDQDDQAQGAELQSNASLDDMAALLDDRFETYWTPGEEHYGELSLTVKLKGRKRFNTVILQEYIEKGQRIESFSVEAAFEGGWRKIYGGTVIGYKKICRFKAVESDGLRLKIHEYRDTPYLRTLKLSHFDRVKGLPLSSRIRLFFNHLSGRVYEFYIKRIKG